MKIVSKIEETLNGGYGGLYGEVVTCDTYRLKGVKFQPDIIFDIGGNVGIFARYARTLFPFARIISVEPDMENCLHYLKFTKDPNTILMQYALGHGQIFHGLTAPNGAHETYLSAGLGYSNETMMDMVTSKAGMVLSDVSSMRLSDIVDLHLKPGMKTLIKVDCEGAENSIWDHPPSMEVLRQMDYIAIEIHFYTLTETGRSEVLKETHAAIKSLELTHHCQLEGVYFWATKRI